jgi:hypothetical protein
MIAQLGMSADECIEQYKNLSEAIFDKGHVWGRLTKGIAKPRFSGGRLRDCV